MRRSASRRRGPGDRGEVVVAAGAGRRRRRTRATSRRPRAGARVLVRSGQPRVGEAARRSRHGSFGVSVLRRAVVGQEVAQRVAQRRREVVVGAEHEHARHVEQRPERVEHRRHRVEVREVVAGVDDEVGLELGERAEPVRFRAWLGVRCRSLTCSTRSGRAPGGQHRDRRRARSGEVARPRPGGVRREPAPASAPATERAQPTGSGQRKAATLPHARAHERATRLRISDGAP